MSNNPPTSTGLIMIFFYLYNKGGNNKYLIFGKVYQGFYKEYYIRSSYEYVYLKILEKNNAKFLMEAITYEFKDGTQYTPDFFIYNEDGEIEEIVEIKAEDKQYYQEGIETNKKMLEEYGVVIKMLSLNELIEICKRNNLNFYKLSQEWKDSPNSTMKKDNRGKRNPMYRHKQTESSKRKNGDKTRERFKDSEFRNKHSNAVKEAMKKVPKEVLKFENRKKNNIITCCICGKSEKVYSSQAIYCNDCRNKYTPWQRTKIRKSLLENIC